MSKKARALFFFQKLPKVDLHAHLSGSCRESTLVELLNEELKLHRDNDCGGRNLPGGGHKGLTGCACARCAGLIEQLKEDLKLMKDLQVPSPSSSKGASLPRNLDDCFRIFAVMHRVISSPAAVARVTREVIADLRRDNVVYAELRTTPRALVETMPDNSKRRVSKREHIATVVHALQAAKQSHPLPLVRLLLTVDRSRDTPADAVRTVRLALDFAGHIVGVDFAGNPNVGGFACYSRAFELARASGLRITVHTGEVDHEADTDFIMRFQPDRMGHAICLDPKHVDRLLAQRIPVELCPTSNMTTRAGGLTEYAQHPFGFLHEKRHPIIICSDDMGVFNITLSDEYFHLSTAFGVSFLDMFRLAREGLDYTFEPKESPLLGPIYQIFSDFYSATFGNSNFSAPRFVSSSTFNSRTSAQPYSTHTAKKSEAQAKANLVRASMGFYTHTESSPAVKKNSFSPRAQL